MCVSLNFNIFLAPPRAYVYFYIFHDGDEDRHVCYQLQVFFLRWTPLTAQSRILLCQATLTHACFRIRQTMTVRYARRLLCLRY